MVHHPGRNRRRPQTGAQRPPRGHRRSAQRRRLRAAARSRPQSAFHRSDTHHRRHHHHHRRHRTRTPGPPRPGPAPGVLTMKRLFSKRPVFGTTERFAPAPLRRVLGWWRTLAVHASSGSLRCGRSAPETHGDDSVAGVDVREGRWDVLVPTDPPQADDREGSDGPGPPGEDRGAGAGQQPADQLDQRAHSRGG